MNFFKKIAFIVPIITCFLSCKKKPDTHNFISKSQIDSACVNFWMSIDKDFETAKSSAHWILLESKKIQYFKGIGSGLGAKSLVFYQEENYDSAIYYSLSALKLRTEINDTNGMVSCYLSLAKIYNKLNQTLLQRHNLAKALTLVNPNGTLQNRISVNSDLAEYYVKIDRLDSAKFKFKEVLNLTSNYKNENMKAIAIENYGNILNQLEENDSALRYYKKCLSLYAKNKSFTKMARIYNNLAVVYWSMEKRDSAVYYLEKGYNETKKLGNKVDLQNYITNLVDYWEEEPDLKKSNAYLHELLDLKDSVFKNNLEENIANIEKDYTVKLKNEENEKLKSEIKRKNTLRNAAIITALLLLLLAFYQLRIYRQKRNLAEQEKQLKENEIDQLLQERELKNMDALLEGRETERKRIGRDLHDRLGSILSTVKLHFSAIDERIDSLKKDNQIQYHKASALLDEAVGEVRKIAQDLVSGVLVKYGLTAALNDMKNTLEATGKITINLFEAGTGERQNLEFEIAIYRMVQELMSNILKHAEATKVDIHITKNAHQFTLMVEDNGKGFDPENPEKFGMGMANIKQRVAALGGVVNFDSKPGAGATVIIEIELEEKNNGI
jgi:signal transduction histidine kinase